ncbi:MAG: cold shock domain-containing protein [Saprospiraceae bacterium]|nr:cold shock domain-containing protein [Saprospiraceae bacterium]MCB9325390.1 cold shock domain-containing protein [Lewinellaceae bacterium]
MAKSQQSFGKKEKEKKRIKKKKEKLERREQRKIEKNENGPVAFEDMLSYVDENGNLTATPPDPSKKKKIKAEDIILGVPPVDKSSRSVIRKGQVKFFNDEKGYGFIIDEETKDSLFVHMNNTAESIRENDKVTFEIEMGPKGANAVNVKLVE